MDSSPRKRGRPKLCVTKEVLEEPRAQKRLQNAACHDPGMFPETVISRVVCVFTSVLQLILLGGRFV